MIRGETGRFDCPFRLDEKALAQVYNLACQVDGKPDISISTMKDGEPGVYTSTDLDEIKNFPNHQDDYITYIEIRAFEDLSNSFVIAFRNRGIDFRLNGQPEKILIIKSKLIDIIQSIKSSYSWLYFQHPYVGGKAYWILSQLPFAAALLLGICMGHPVWTKDGFEWRVAAAFLLASICFNHLLAFLRGQLFPRAVFALQKGIEREKALAFFQQWSLRGAVAAIFGIFLFIYHGLMQNFGFHSPFGF